MQDIEIGDPFFDDQFLIKGNSPEKIKLLFADAIAILNHSQENPQMDADRRRIVCTRRSTYRIVQVIQDCYRIRELCQRLPGIHLWIKDDEGLFGTDFPEGVDELHFECAGVITETELLKYLFGLFGLILERLVQIDSAYEDDPQITLK